MTKTTVKGESDRANSVGVSIADPKATATLPGEKECEAAYPSNRQPIDAFEKAIRLLAHRQWKAAECPAGSGAKLLLEAEREETAPSGHDQALPRDRNLSPRLGRTFEEAIRLLARRKWEAAGCPAGTGVEHLLAAEREVTAPSGHDQAPLKDRNLSPRLGTSDESPAATRGDFAMQSRTLLPCEELDCDLVQRVKRFLHQKGYAPHRTLEISVERGKVVVQGRVPTFYLRQIAVECIKRVAGVTQIVDRIDVVDRPGSRQSNDNSEDDALTHVFGY